MNYNEFNKLVSKFKESGLNDDQIMNVLIETFRTNQCSLEDLEIMVNWFGYELTDGFYKDNKIEKHRL